MYVCAGVTFFLVFLASKYFLLSQDIGAKVFFIVSPKHHKLQYIFFSFLMTEDLLVQETSKKNQNYTSKLIGVTNPREWWVIVAGFSFPLIPSFFNFFIWRAIPFVLIFGENLDTGNKVHIKKWFQAEFTMNNTSKFFNSVVAVRLSFKKCNKTSHHFLVDYYPTSCSSPLAWWKSSHCQLSLQSCNFSLSSSILLKQSRSPGISSTEPLEQVKL